MDADLKSIALSLLLFSSTATLDEMSSRGMREIGAVPHTRTRIQLKIGVGVGYVAMNEAVKKRRRGVRWGVRVGVPVMFGAAAIHNEWRKRR